MTAGAAICMSVVWHRLPASDRGLAICAAWAYNQRAERRFNANSTLTAAACEERALADPVPSTVIRTYKFRLLPRKGQHVKLREALEHTRELYNAALEERIGAFQKKSETRRYMTQCKALTVLRTDPEFTRFSVSLQRWPLRRLDIAFEAFFRRVAAGEYPGFPRFKRELRSFGFAGISGWGVKGRVLYMRGIGNIKLHMHRKLPVSPISCQVKQYKSGWVVLLACIVPVEALPKTGKSIGIDLGITNFIATSDGEIVAGLRAVPRNEAEMRRRRRAIARCAKGSNGRRKARRRLSVLCWKISNQRSTFQHQIAARIVRENDVIAIENLGIKGLANSILGPSVKDAAWGKFTELLFEKAEKAARTVIKVNPRGTSQTCPACGIIKAKPLRTRIHECDCGEVLDRDIAAAKVILMRAVAGPLSLNVDGCVRRAAGKISLRG